MIENFILDDCGMKNFIECEIDSMKDVMMMKSGDRITYVKLDDLYALALLILKPEQRDSLIPVRQTKITKFYKQHRIKAKKNIKKGEQIIVNCEIDVPTVIEENIKAFLKPRVII